MADWANLPTDIMILVVQRLHHMEDFISMLAVCKPWQSLKLMFDKSPSLPPRSPFLLVTPRRKKLPKFKTLLSTNSYEFELPEACRRIFLGTCRGWLLAADHKNVNFNLLHLFSRREINLPSLFVFKDESKYTNRRLGKSLDVKLAMSRNPIDENTKENCIVLVISPRYPVLAFARIGDKVWTSMAPYHKHYNDVVYYKGVFYAVDGDGVLFICDVYSANENSSTAVTDRVVLGTRDMCDKKYLVESSGDLLLVSRLRSNPWCNSFTHDLFVHKLEHEDATGVGGYPYRWKEVDSLGGRSLFVGGNASVSVHPANHLNADRVYFFNDFQMIGCWCHRDNGDMWVYKKIIKPYNITHPKRPVWYF